MSRWGLALAFGMALVAQSAAARPTPQSPPADAAPHGSRFVATDDGVRLEVLDYGGAGSPVILLSGHGQTAHAFDQFAPRLAARHRVYAITRRGGGLSDTPPATPANYDSRRLTRDVINVMDQLGVDRAALAGWSFGGAEVSGVAHNHRDRVTAVVYLDAAYAYAFYAPGNAFPAASNVEIGLADLRDKLRAARLGPPENAEGLYDEVLTEIIPNLEVDIRAARDRRRQLHESGVGPPGSPSRLMMRDNMARFGALKGIPILAIFAEPPPPTAMQTAAQRADRELEAKWTREQIGRYRAAHPSARVVELPGATHDVFNSHPEVVLREMEALLGAPGSVAP